MTTVQLSSSTFPIEEIDLCGTTESVLRGGRHLLPLLPRALQGVDEIGVIGWGSQGAAQAHNLRESLAGTGIGVRVGLRPGSPSWGAAAAAGFAVGEVFDVAATADLVLLLISDAAQVAIRHELFAALQPGATLGLSHGFLVAHLRAIGEPLPAGVNVIAVCPKGMGLSVRRLYEQGRDEEGAGINASVAIAQDVDGWATDQALAWAVALGAPYTFATTMEDECRSDVFGERGILLGALHGIVETLYRRACDQGADPRAAFLRGCETVTGPIARTISSRGLLGVLDALDDAGRAELRRAYDATYGPVSSVLAEIYDEVASGRELLGVLDAGDRMARHPMGEIEGTRMWEVGACVRRERAAGATQTTIDPFAAGVFLATMVAQVDVLREHGHSWSEVVNESIIEAVDSLIPYMHARGVAYMVDSCSVTARLGARRWGPVFEAALARIAYPAAQRGHGDAAAFDRFLAHDVHGVLATLSTYRPSVDIAVA